MASKAFAVLALAALALFAAPAAANAAGYIAASNITVTGKATAGGTVAVNFANSSFSGGETVGFGVDGSGSVTLSTFKAATVSSSKTATSAGAVVLNVSLPSNASGSYTVTATGATSSNVGTATITVLAADGLADTGNPLAKTGYDAPMLLIWSAVGILLLGAAFVIVMTIVRRQRAQA